MKSAVENLTPTKVRLTVEVSYDELKPSIDHAYAHIAEQVSVPGFRKGKVPPRIIDQRVGRAAVIEHAVNDGLSGFYAEAVKENGLRPLASPSVDVTQAPGLPGGIDELHFTAEVTVRPEITLPDLSTLSVSVSATEVSDEDVDARLDALRERFATLVGVDRPAKDGDFVQLDLTATVDGEQVDQVSGVSYQIGSGSMLDGMDEALLGLSASETTTFGSTLVGGPHAGSAAQVTLTPSAVKERQMPEADDEFAELASEFDTIDELRDDLRAQAVASKADTQVVEARDALLEVLLETVEIPVPEDLVAEEVENHLSGEDREGDDAHRAEVTEESTDALRRQILLDTLAEQLDVKVGQNELVEYLVQAARQYGADPNEFISTLSDRGQIPAVVADVARGKSLIVALRQVAVTAPDGTAVDLSEQLGSDAEEQDDAEEQAETSDDGDTPEPGSATDISGVLG